MEHRSDYADQSKSIYDELRLNIITLRLPPGTLLRPKDIADRRGVSVTPVREALLQLKHDGLVDIRPQSQTCVSRISLTALKSAYVLRLALETEVTLRLVEQGDADKLEPARRAVTRHADAAATGESHACREAGRAFHSALFRGANLAGLSILLERKSGSLKRVDRLIEGPDETEVVEIHNNILRRIHLSDRDGAAIIMRHHIDITSKSVAAAAHSFPDFFCS